MYKRRVRRILVRHRREIVIGSGLLALVATIGMGVAIFGVSEWIGFTSFR